MPKTTKSFTIDEDLHEKAKDEYDNMSGRINDLLEEDLAVIHEEKDQELDRIKREIEDTEEEINSLERSLEKEKDRKDRLDKKKQRIEKKIKEREAKKESKNRFFNSQLEKFERERGSREYSGLEESEKREKFLDEYGNGIYNKFENKVDADLSRAEFEREFKEFLKDNI